MSPLQSYAVGSVVGAQRWPYSSGHPDGWGTPHRGIVLAINDPRAWEHTMRFAGVLPTQEEVDHHIAYCQKNGLLHGYVPVEWEFGHIYWEPASSLRPYDEDVKEWEQLRANAVETA